ncbi:minor capsid protein [Jodiemicrovirus-1]|nr:minor capsid protein [Jodiemicrovirus-1]
MLGPLSRFLISAAPAVVKLFTRSKPRPPGRVNVPPARPIRSIDDFYSKLNASKSPSWFNRLLKLGAAGGAAGALGSLSPSSTGDLPSGVYSNPSRFGYFDKVNKLSSQYQNRFSGFANNLDTNASTPSVSGSKLLSGIPGNLLSLAGGIGTGLFSRYLDRKSINQSNAIQQAAEDRAWKRETEYNHPAPQMARFREAGLNPALMYSSSLSSASGTTHAPLTSRSSYYQDRIASYLSLANMHAQNKLLDAQARSVNADVFGKEKINRVLGDYGFSTDPTWLRSIFRFIDYRNN